MKSKAVLVSLILIFLNFTIIYPWGEKGHKLINEKAIEFLPDEMNYLKSFKNYIGEHASDADLRRDNGFDKTEAPRHYIDIDFYPEFLNAKMIYNKNELIKIYGEESVTKMGLLPWATLETFNNLKKSFEEKNRDKVLIYSADLGHYVGDGHQPFHTILNYNGQLTDQKGVHGRYESEMVNAYFNEISSSIASQTASYIQNPLDYIFDYLAASNSYSEVIFSADKIAFEQAKSHGSEDYYRIIWFRTKHLTKGLFSNASAALASLIYTAWVDAGKPNLNELN